ncbi:MAG: 2Fe-2S iron-sulfur cluster-binding protein [Planctomycetes bacterium]|nr:2Fe-2S iron-sulfur cluster-binding protein [Planctomycetota bacterium]
MAEAVATEQKTTATVTVDGATVEVKKGEMLIEAISHLKHIPHYCYHPGLSIAGNCRMCLVTVEGIPKPAIACATEVKDGMICHTLDDKTAEARRIVLEFLLINHPLDCPVCDKSGECMLQDFSYEYGQDRSRFEEHKVTADNKVFSDHVIYDTNRCISCTRCVRFMEEIDGFGGLCMVQRGDHSKVDIFPGRPVDTLLSGNIVDICPVGALLSKDFLYQHRVWWLEKTDSVCPMCSKNCSIEIDTNLEGDVKRIRPRENERVNEWWMCDIGRYALTDLAENRLESPAGTEGAGKSMKDAIQLFASKAAEAKGKAKVAVSLFASNEEMFLAKKLADKLEAKIAVIEPAKSDAIKFRKFEISGDRAANRTGAALILGETASGVDDVETVIVLGTNPDGSAPEIAKSKAKLLVLTNKIADLAKKAVVALPAALFTEREGSYVNHDNHVQRFKRATFPKSGFGDLQIIAECLKAAGEARYADLSASGVFDLLAKEIPAFAGMSHRSLGKLGEKIRD